MSLSDAPTIKLLLMGDSGTGKSSLLLRFSQDRFLGEDVHAATIGVDFKIKFIEMANGLRIKLTIWDTAGQERFRTLTSSYYRGADGVLLVYDITDRASFKNIRSVWIKELEMYADLEKMTLMLVGNKIDKRNREGGLENIASLVTMEEGQELAQDLGALFVESSAKTKIGVTEVFEDLVASIISKIQKKKSPSSPSSALMMNDGQGDVGSEGGLFSTITSALNRRRGKGIGTSIDGSSHGSNENVNENQEDKNGTCSTGSSCY